MEATLKETRDELEMDKQTLVCDRASFIHSVLLTVLFYNRTHSVVRFKTWKTDQKVYLMRKKCKC